MKKSKAKLLVETLRSGKYKQGRFQLRTNDTFCCLGVACDLYAKETGKGKWIEPEFDNERKCYTKGTMLFKSSDGDCLKNTLPTEVQEWFGFQSSGGAIADNNEQSLWMLNDQRRSSFDQIADIIEQNVENL